MKRANLNNSPYTHTDEISNAISGAARIVPVIVDIVGCPGSVVDLGGGSGAWLKEFQSLGVEDVLLLDSASVVPNLVIEKSVFQSINLETEIPELRRFDLAICVECLEHVPETRAAALIEWLTKVTDIVVFSAAIPGQGGKGHINEQPPDYWRDKFKSFGFERHDVLRSRIIHDSNVPWWYRQNLYLFKKPSASLRVREEDFLPDDFFLIYGDSVGRLAPSPVRKLLQQLGPAILAAIKRRVRRDIQ